MACKIIYKDGKIERVNAPNGQQSELFDSILALPEVNSDPEVALRLYAQVYTPEFKARVGDWEPIAVAKGLASNVTGLYEEIFANKTQQALFEAAMQANSSESEKRGAIKAFGEEIVNIAQNMFPTAKVGDEYTPAVNISLDKNGEPAIEYINSSSADTVVTTLLKVVNALRRSPRNNYPSNQVAGFYNDLRKYGATEQQINILKDYIARHNITEVNKNDLINGFMAEMPFTIEVREARESKYQRDEDAGVIPFEKDGKYFVTDPSEGTASEISKEIYDKYVAEKDDKSVPTDHYHSMTVPGGTNYRENRIVTPDITPAIQGHAQFAEKNDIGWFRSDEKASKGGNQIQDLGEDPAWSGNRSLFHEDENAVGSKTRRILELQSDLFQKGRDRASLVNRPEVFENDLKEEDPIKRDQERRNLQGANTIENDFLQILNKDNSWVSYFIQSIIQDSVKKGYEKVLFPSGQTAAKIEGHQTVEQYIESRELRIEQADKSIANIQKEKEAFSSMSREELATKYFNPTMFGSKTKEEQDQLISDHLSGFDKNIASITNEKKQFEKELEDARAGKAQLSAIANFYENTIQNILRKKGYDPTRIKDEFGNEWFEVELDQKRDRSPIFLSATNKLQSSKAAPITIEKVRAFLKSIGMRSEDIKEVTSIIHDGKEVDALAMADTVNRVMQIVEGKVDVTLPEEAMHFLVAILKHSRPQLYQTLIDNVRDYKIYKEIVNSPEYTESKFYKKANGALDVEKLKEEAVAKVLAEYLIDGLEGVTEKPHLIEKAMSWWKQMLQWIMDKFGKYTNPFQEIADNIANERTEEYGDLYEIHQSGVYLSATAESLQERDAKFTSNRPTFDTIKDKTDKLNITKVNQVYYKNGVPGTKRVSDLVEEFYADLFRNKIIPEDMKPFYEQTRKDGDYIHQILEDILTRLIDEKTGLLRDEIGPKASGLVANPLANTTAYDYLAKNIIDRLKLYPIGTRFMVEQVIYDETRNIFGTVDFIAVLPDGKVDILDWKSLYFEHFSKKAGIRDYKEEAFNIQIKEYKRMLKDGYGIENFRQLRAIPIKKIYKVVKDGAGVPTGERVLSNIQIGAAEAKEISDLALRPVIVKDETTGNKKLDSFLNILEKVAQDLKDKVKDKVFNADLYELVKNSIYDLRVSQNIDNLYRHTVVEVRAVVTLLKDIELNKANYSNEQVNNILGELNYYYDLMDALEKSAFLIDEPGMDEDSIKKLKSAKYNYDKMKEKIDEERKELADRAAKSFGIFNLLKPEKAMHFWGKYMRNMSQAQTASVQLLYKMVSKVFNRVDLQSRDEDKRLEEARQGVSNWATKNGSSVKDALAHLLKLDKDGEWNGNMISTIDSDFYKERDKVLKSGDKNAMLKWWSENYNLPAYTTWYNSEFVKYKEDIKLARYSEDDKTDQETKIYLLERFEKRFNIVKYTSTALGPHNKEVWSKNIKLDQWHSKGYQFLLKPENVELLNAYKLFTSINKELGEIGIIDAWRENTFVPNVRKGFAETFGFEKGGLFKKTAEGTKVWIRDFKDSLKVTDQQLNYSGYVNPLTGEKENKLFAAYTAEIGEWVKTPNGDTKLSYSKKSADLFTIYSLMNRQKLKYKYLQDIENIAQSLRHIEASKGSIQTSTFGRVQRDKQGNIKEEEQNLENTEILNKHIRAAVYGETIQNDTDSYISLSWNRFAQAWNKSPFGKIKQMKEVKDEKPHGISANKVLMKLNNANSVRVLGLNLASAVSNLFGGTASTFLINKQMFTDKDLAEAATQMVSGAWYASDEMKKRAALADYFLPLLDTRANYHSQQLSVSSSVRILSEDWIMAPMRKTEHIVQMNIFLATIANTMVENGELVNIRKFVQDKNGWSARFNMSTGEREALTKKVEEEITALKKDRSLVKIATFEKVKVGKKEETIVKIPGIERGSTTVQDFRESIHNLSKNVLGSSSEFDLAAYKYNMWARLFMSFKNWIPRTLDVRFGEFRYDAGHDAYEWGRFRMFYRAFTANLIKSFLKITPFVGRLANKLEDKTYLIDRAKKIYDEKVKLYKSLGLYNEEQFIKEDDFVQAFLQGVTAEFTEFRNIFILWAIFVSSMFAPDPDDDDDTKGAKKKMLRQIDKLTDELSFFYSPSSLIDVMGSKPLPVIGLLGDTWKAVTQTSKEWFGSTFNIADGKWEDQAKPMKYIFKVLPVTKELLGWMPIIDPEMAKEMGIQITTQNRN